MMKHALIGGGCVHAGIAGNDPSTAYMLVQKFRHIVDFAANSYPMTIGGVVVQDKIGDTVDLAFLCIAAVGSEDVLQVSTLGHQLAKHSVDLFFRATAEAANDI